MKPLYLVLYGGVTLFQDSFGTQQVASIEGCTCPHIRGGLFDQFHFSTHLITVVIIIRFLGCQWL